jgi:hypothetical protein
MCQILQMDEIGLSLFGSQDGPAAPSVRRPSEVGDFVILSALPNFAVQALTAANLASGTLALPRDGEWGNVTVK